MASTQALPPQAAGASITHYTICPLCERQVEPCPCRLMASHLSDSKVCRECMEEFEVEYNAGD